MKKLLTILLCAALVLSLAACGGTTGGQEPGGSQTGDTQDPGKEDGKNEPSTPENPGEDKTPENPENSDGDKAPETPENSENPEDPETPENPDTPDVPDMPDEPDTPDVPDTPDEPDTPDVPDTPDEPDTPDVPDTPDEPDTPDVPDTPDEPDTPDVPDTPDEPDEGDGEGEDAPTPPPFGGPGFNFGGGIVTPGGSGEQEDIPVADPGDLVDKLDALCADIIEGSYCSALRSSAEFSNYFSGIEYTEGMRVAMNHLQMAPPAHVVMLIEVPEGQDAEAYAKNLADNANPRWMVCATAASVQYVVKDNLVLFVMSSEENANAVIAAFNG